MTRRDAEALVRFVKDHDTRFTASVAEGEGDDCAVRLTRADDNTPEEPVTATEDYARRYVLSSEAENIGPTIREAWGKWMGARGAA